MKLPRGWPCFESDALHLDPLVVSYIGITYIGITLLALDSLDHQIALFIKGERGGPPSDSSSLITVERNLSR